LGESYLCQERWVQNLKSYYTFFVTDGRLCSTIFSDLKARIFVSYVDRESIKPTKFIFKEEEKCEIYPISFRMLRKKKRLIQTILSQNSSLENFCLSMKSKCNACFESCLFSFKQIEILKKDEVLKELSRHHHPKNRMINKKSRSLQQGKDELRKHYETVHFLKN